MNILHIDIQDFLDSQWSTFELLNNLGNILDTNGGDVKATGKWL